jgi:uncharacterized membrane protein YdfJ with MMPL/SSD domain
VLEPFVVGAENGPTNPTCGALSRIIFDATVIWALLVPAIMRLAGSWNWWFPARIGRMLLVSPRPARQSSR